MFRRNPANPGVRVIVAGVFLGFLDFDFAIFAVRTGIPGGMTWPGRTLRRFTFAANRDRPDGRTLPLSP
jgi:hypothetical protein